MTNRLKVTPFWAAAGLCTAAYFAVAMPAAAAEDQASATVEEIVVTGSRLKRDGYSTPIPLQVLSIDDARKTGITSMTELLQRTTAATGQQINGDFNGNAGASNASEPPPPGGVGSASIGLRALGPERTLVLVNSKRLGSSSVRGAPTQPDINLLPMNMVQSVEVLTEGVSSIYGADAVAGVVNVLLRDEFEGLEITVNAERPEEDGGETNQFSFLTGATGDRAHFVLGGEYYERERIAGSDRASCLRTLAKAEDGTSYNVCRDGFYDNVVLDLDGANPQDIFSYYTPGSTNIGIPDWSSAAALPFPEPPGAAETANQRDKFTYIPFYSDQQERLNADLVTPLKRFSLVTLGGFKPEWFGANEEVYFETYYFNRELVNHASYEQIFPTVPGLIPQEDANGNIIVDGTGAPVLVDNPLNPFPVNASPIITMDDIPQRRKVELEHMRFVGGLRGDITAGWFGDRNWSFDGFFSYDRGTGDQSQPVLDENALLLSLETARLNSDGEVICGVPASNNDIGFLTPAECVPVNFFAPSVFTGGRTGEGAFATDAERDFLLATRTNHTVVEQTMFSLYFTGDLFDIAEGSPVQVAFGGEYRLDQISSSTDVLGAKGGVAAENPLAEGATNGDRDIFDLFAEFNAPLITGVEGIELLELAGSIRYTDEENFGNETTYSARLTYSPIDWVTASASIGTSFRAPNLREQFLADQFSSIGGASDPCRVPTDANVGGAYDATRDARPQVVLDNCVLDGVDPTVLGLQGTVSVPVSIGGNAQDLKAETSDSFTATLLMNPPISDEFDINISVSYFDIDIEDTVRSINGTTILERCYNDAANLASPFCSRIQRPGGNQSFNFPTLVDASFINVGKETSSGIDVNLQIQTTFENFGRNPLNVSWNQTYTRQLERDLQIFAGDSVDNQVGDFGIPENQYVSTVSATWGAWDFVWQARYLDGTHAGIDASLSADCGIFQLDEGFIGSPNVAPVCNADSIWYHDVSGTYNFDETLYVTLGVNNVADEDPPLISRSAGSNRLNRVTSSGYDQFGRSYFLQLTKSF
ncbi:MAG: TonB-dependent receptor [Pseudomonadales bacterium]